MAGFKELYKDKRFLRVSDQTKTDIINAIGIDINDAKQDIAESKFTQEELTEALHYLLATEAKKGNNNAERIVVREDARNASAYVGTPFYFGNNDTYIWYWPGHIGHHDQQSICGDLGSSDGSRDCNCNSEGLCVCLAATALCAAGCCCAACMRMTLKGPEAQQVKTAKVTAATITGGAVFVALMWYFIQEDVWRASLVDDHNWDVTGYRVFQTLIAGMSGLLASSLVSTINNIWQCLPKEERQIPEPSAQVLDALHDLQTIKTFLSQGWSRPNDDRAQCNAFIRAVIMMYIKTIANNPALEVKVEPVLSSSRHSAFGRVDTSRGRDSYAYKALSAGAPSLNSHNISINNDAPPINKAPSAPSVDDLRHDYYVPLRDDVPNTSKYPSAPWRH